MLATNDGILGEVYVIHFKKPYKHARHYIGWATDVEARLERHRNGTGARLMEVITAAGIEWEVALILPGTRALERKLKNLHGAHYICPVCISQRREAECLSLAT